MTAYPEWLAAYPDWERVSWCQVSDYLDVFFPVFGWITGHAYVIVTFSWGVYRDGGKVRWRHRQEQAYSWPGQRRRLIAEVVERVPYADISICTNLMRDKRRRKGNSALRFIAHADIDGGFDAETERAVARMPGGYAVGSGTPGHAHVYAVMRVSGDELDLPNHEHLCRVIGEWFGAEDPKISDNDTMRLPGTFNFKPLAHDPNALPLPVRWAVHASERPTPTRLRQFLGTRKVYPGQRSSDGAHGGGPGSQADTEEVADLAGRYPRVWAAVQKTTDTGDPTKPTDRSKDTTRIVGACVDAGLTLPQTRWVVNQREDLRERIASRHDDDVGRCFAKITADRDEKRKESSMDSDEQAAQEQDQPPGDGGGGDDGGRQRLEDAFVGAHIADTRMRGRYLFSGAFRWMHYDGRLWRQTEDPVVAEVIRLALIDFCAQELRGGVSDERRKKLFALLSASRMRGIMSVIRGRLAREGAEFDAHPHLLNAGNCVIDLRDGSTQPHHPELLFTRATRTHYDPDAAHDDWDKALTAVEKEVADWLQLRLGQGLTGFPPTDDVLVVLRGSGENGKTTIVDGVRGGVGADYAVPLSDRVLLVRPGDHPTELMTLRDARLAIVEEFPELGHLSVKQLKTLMGTEYITARHCGMDNVRWRATHTPFVTTNYMPRVDESDHGTWRRLAMVEFPYRYRKAHEAIERDNDVRGDDGLRMRIRNGREGQHKAVLAWLVEGAVRWYGNGQVMPEPPEVVRKATAAWRETADVLLRYVGERLVFDAESHVMGKELYEDFSGWLKDSGHHVWTDQNFSARLGQHSLVADRGVRRQNRVHSSRKGLSRRSLQLFEGTSNGQVPRQYAAWLGLRFRTKADDDHVMRNGDDQGE